MVVEDNKLSFIFAAKDEEFVTYIKKHLNPLESDAALSFWPYDFAIEDYLTKRHNSQAKKQLNESTLFIILWSPELVDYLDKSNGEVNPFKEHIKPFLLKDALTRNSIYSIIVRSNKEKDELLESHSSVIIPKLGASLKSYQNPKEVLDMELSKVENAIYGRLLGQRIQNLPGDRFSKNNLYRLANFFISNKSNYHLYAEILQPLINGDIDQLISITKRKNLEEELKKMVEQEKQEREKQRKRKNYQKENILLSIFEAKLLILKGMDPEAERIYQEAHKLDPQNFEILDEWRDLLKKNRERQIKARQIELKIENAISLLKQEGDYAFSNGNFHYNNKEYENADEWLKKALDIRKILAERSPSIYLSDYIYALLQLGVLYYDLLIFKEARWYFHEVQTLRKAILEKKLNDDEQQALKDYAFSLFWLGQLYAHAENPERDIQRAINYFEKAVGIRIDQLPPENEINIEEIIKILKSCSNLYLEVGNDQKAQELKNEARKKSIELLERSFDSPQPLKGVFISYSSKDKATVEKIRFSLEKHGIQIVIDSKDMDPLDSIEEFISRSIRETDFTLSIVSKNSLVSAWVAQETIYSIYTEEKLRKKRFIPAYIDDSFLNKKQFTLDAMKKIDEEIKEVNEEIKERKAMNKRHNDLHKRLKRLENLDLEFTDILERLRESGCIDLTEENFEEGIKKIANKIG